MELEAHLSPGISNDLLSTLMCLFRATAEISVSNQRDECITHFLSS